MKFNYLKCLTVDYLFKTGKKYFQRVGYCHSCQFKLNLTCPVNYSKNDDWNGKKIFLLEENEISSIIVNDTNNNH